eukprot:5644081-Amphidinium_carterae.1
MGARSVFANSTSCPLSHSLRFEFRESLIREQQYSDSVVPTAPFSFIVCNRLSNMQARRAVSMIRSRTLRERTHLQGELHTSVLCLLASQLRVLATAQTATAGGHWKQREPLHACPLQRSILGSILKEKEKMS